MQCADETAVLHAARTGSLGRLRTTVSHDRALVLRAADPEGRTVLHLACMRGRPAVVVFLLGLSGIDINQNDRIGRTPLYTAALSGHAAIVEVLLCTPGIVTAGVNDFSRHGHTMLGMACKNGQAAIVALLLGVPGIDVNRAKFKGVTPLLGACSDRTLCRHREIGDIVKLLLAAPGIELDCATVSGQTPLTHAAARGHEVIVRLLVGHGARTHNLPNLPASNQPETYARRFRHIAIADYLRDVHAAGGFAKYRAEPRLQLLLLRALCQQGRASVVRGHRAEEKAAVAAAAAATSASATFYKTEADGAEAEVAQHVKRHRLLYERLFGATPRPRAACDDGDDDGDGAGGGARAAPTPRLAGVPGGIESRSMRLIIEFWWSPS